MKFLIVNTPDGTTVFLNPSHVCSVYEGEALEGYKAYSAVVRTIDGAMYVVTEKADDIVNNILSILTDNRHDN